MRVLDAEAARAIDRWVIDELGLPGVVLMEHAADAVVETLLRRWPAASRVVVCCGPGNNGGDGWAVARLLATRGVDACVVALGSGAGDAAIQERVTRALGIEVFETLTDRELQDLEAPLRDADVVVDALFGTGLTRPLQGRAAELVAAMVASDRPILAVDLPSGLEADRADLPAVAVWAEATVTFVAPKIAHVLAPAREACGEVVVAELGFPASLLERFPCPLALTTPGEFAQALPPRPRDLHKGQAGKVLVVAGSVGMAGAAVLAGRAALRAGAGLVTLAVPEAIGDVVAGASLETMTLRLPADSRGRLAGDALPKILEAAARADAVALGPGLGGGDLDEGLAALLRRVVLACRTPMVVDADGLNAFEGRIGELTERTAPTVLTPHAVELARLLDADLDELLADRLASVREAAWCARSVVLLKGRQSLTSSPEGVVAINPTGGPVLATGGSGDVLTGVVGALLAGGMAPFEAARMAAYWHGAAGDSWSASRGDRGLLAGELLELLPDVLERSRVEDP